MTLLEKLSVCGFYPEMYAGAPLSSQSTSSSLQRQSKLALALPELYAAIIVFVVKAHTYLEARGMYMCTYGI